MEPIEPVVNRFLIQKITSTGGNGGTLLKAAVIFGAKKVDKPVLYSSQGQTSDQSVKVWEPHARQVV